MPIINTGIIRGKGCLLPATQAYISRVVADGGTVLEPRDVDKAFRMIAAQGLTVAAAYASDWGVKKDGSNNVSKLYSLTGAGSDLVQAVGANQPLWASGQQNGEPAITFNGTSHTMKATAFTLNQPETVFAAYKVVSHANAKVTWDGNTLNTMLLQNSSVAPAINAFSGAYISTVSPNGVPVGSWGQLTVRYQQNSNQLRLNGTDIGAMQAGGASNAGGFTLGSDANSANWANVAFGEIIILSANTSNTAAVESYLKSKWGTP